tara:strand:- start:70 stop:711 length:642 start_codon:yes stop_codon:yes gene_type:complete
LPTSALIFYLIVVILWKFEIIPPPIEILNMLEGLYNQFGLLGLAIGAFLEGIVYLGLYFPGSTVVALAVFISDGSFMSLFQIALVVAGVLTITSFINYFLGRNVKFKEKRDKIPEKHIKFSKKFILAFLHPNILAFYFFNAGIKREGFWKISLVPLIMIPWGLVIAYILSATSEFIKNQIESAWFMTVLIFVWIVVAFIIDHKKKIKKELHIN